LVISWPWLQLGSNGSCLEAKREGRIIGRWPLRRLSAIVLLSPANLSTALIERCLQQDVTLGITLQSGRQHLVMPPLTRHTYELAHQHALWHAALDAPTRLAMAQGLVDAKLHNTATLIAQRDAKSPVRKQLQEIQRMLPISSDLPSLRGYEGHAARLHFAWLNAQIRAPLREQFAAQRRARGAPDRLNSLLNFGYYLLAARMRVWLRLQALNPYLAWLHDAEAPYETLVYDLIEPFRPFVDRLVLRHINRQEVRAQHFAKQPGQHRLVPEAAARFAQAFEASLGERVGQHLLRDLLWLQARAVRAAVQQKGPLWIFRWQIHMPPASPRTPSAPLVWMAEDGDAWGPPTASGSPPWEAA
jgi:CRISPR-associated protein Cas1